MVSFWMVKYETLSSQQPMIQAVNDMARYIGWVMMGVIILLIWCHASAEPISGWHPSARDYFKDPGSGLGENGASVPIIPLIPENRSVQKNTTSASPVQVLSEGGDQEAGGGARILVRYNTSEVSALADVEIEGIALEEDLSTSLPGLVVYSAQRKSEEEAIKKLSSLPGVLYAEPDYILSIDRTPDDPELWRQWGIANTGQVYREDVPPGKAGSDGKVLSAWDMTTSSGDVIVAVLDTGVDYSHPDLMANMWTGPSGEHGANVITGTKDPMDDNGHGTHCAGIIGAVGNNNVGGCGVAWQTKLMAVKAIGANGKAYTSDIIKGIEYATSAGADIISCSFGGPENSQGLYDAIAASPALFVCAAGNQGKNNDQEPHYPSSYQLPNIISVAATTSSDTLVPTSNYGTSVHCAAPGEDLYSTSLSGAGGSRYRYMTGTSQATAFVAGMISLVMSADTSLTAPQIRTLLISTSDRVPELEGKVAAQGRVNLTAALAGISGQDAIRLYQGWNFVSVPRPLASGKDTAQIFGSVSSGGHSVLEYLPDTGWRTLKASDPVSIMTGYWVYSTKDDSIRLQYAPSPGIVRKQIQKGWNTWGLPMKEPVKAKTALSAIQKIWKYVIGYDGVLQQYESPILNGGSGDQSDDRLVRPQLGYWLYSTGEGEITG